MVNAFSGLHYISNAIVAPYLVIASAFEQPPLGVRAARSIMGLLRMAYSLLYQVVIDPLLLVRDFGNELADNLQQSYDEYIKCPTVEAYLELTTDGVCSAASRQWLESGNGSSCYANLYYRCHWVLDEILTVLIIAFVAAVGLLALRQAVRLPLRLFSLGFVAALVTGLPCGLALSNLYPVDKLLIRLGLLKANSDLQLVEAFRKAPVSTKISAIRNHPHGFMAAHRAFWHRWILEMIRAAGRTPYEVSFSNRNAAYGYHEHYSPRDLKWKRRCDRLRKDDVLVMIDVDYYLDMPMWLSYQKPIVAYTMSPQGNRAMHKEATAVFDGTMLATNVVGGGEYEHGLWHYSKDYLTNGAVSFRIDRLRISDFHIIVLLSPAGPHVVGTPMLTRYHCTVSDGVTATRELRDGKEMVVLANDSMSAAIPVEIFGAICSRAKTGKTLYVGDVDAAFRRHGLDSYAGSSLLYQYALGGERRPATVNYCAQVGDADASLEHPRAVDVIRPFKGLEPYVATKCQSNMDAAVQMRIENVRNEVSSPPERYKKYAEDFVLNFPEAKVLPITHEEVLERQDGKLQKARNRRAIDNYVGVSAKSSAFVKVEGYAEDKDPRNISNLATPFQIELSRYTLPVKSLVLRNIHWYQPGGTPEEIAEAVYRYVEQHSSVAETDFSRFDGTISEWLRRNVEFAVYKRVLDRQSWHGFWRLAKEELDLVVRTGSTEYEVRGSRLSGSPLTTDGNTIIAAYVDYCALREGGAPNEDAWRRIGLHFGDDGISEVNGAEVVAGHLGLRLKLAVKTGTPVGFLGRLFTNPWAHRGSMQDPSRVWVKINLTLVGKSLPELRGKWLAYSQSDRDVPILGTYTRRMLDLTDGPTAETDSYIQRTVGCSWPQAPKEESGPIEAEFLGIDNPCTVIANVLAANDIESVLNAIDEAITVQPATPTNLNSRTQLTPPAVHNRTINVNQEQQHKASKTRPTVESASGKAAQSANKPAGGPAATKPRE